MPKYVIEREVPGASKMSADEIKALSVRSCSVLNQLGPQIQWLHSYVTDNKIYCLYISPNEEMLREHARIGGFPANQIARVNRSSIPPPPRADGPRTGGGKGSYGRSIRAETAQG
jgi:hypothetical protein